MSNNKEIIIKHEKPPCYDRCVKEFGIDWDKGIIITYGGIIYSKKEVSCLDIAHELIHVRQQHGWDPDEYLEKFIADPKFRLDSEVEAFQAGVKYVKEHHPRSIQRRCIHEWATRLSGPNYGNIITYEKAKALLLKP